MAEVVISETMEPQAVSDLSQRYDTLYDPALVEDRAALEGAVADARALIVRNRTRVDDALLEAAPRLRAVGRLGVGLDNIDVPACRDRGIAVHPATGANAVAVAEYVVAAILLLRRRCFAATAEVAAGDWPRARYQGGDEVDGATLALVGFGDIGRAVARRAQALGMTVIAHDPALAPDDPAWADAGVRPRALADLLREADALSLHVPKTPQTHHLIDAAALARLPAHAVLVNTARGGVVDEAALADALRQGRLAGAALDVFEAEPLPAGSPLAACDNVLLTPHVAGLTRQSNRRVSDSVVRQIRATLDRAGR
jgi:(S)-sulfolactate dehydrogenase